MANKKRLISSIRIFTFFSRTFGVLPLKLDASENIVLSKLNLVYGTFALIMLFALRCYFFYHLPNKDFGIILYKITELVTPACVLFSYSCYIFNIKKISHVLTEVFTLSELISSTDFYKNAKKLTVSQILILGLLIILYYVSSVIDNILYFNEQIETVIAIVLDKVVECYMRLGITLIALQFSNVLFFFRELIVIINEDLLSMVGRNVFATRSNLNSVNKKKLQESKILKIAADADNTAPLIDLHDHISDLCEKWNWYFGGTLIAISLTVLLQILTAIFYMVTPENSNFPLNFLLTIVYHSLVEWFILYACELLTIEAKRTGSLIHKVIKDTKNTRLKDQLQEFSVELLHRDISFNAWRLFPVNYTLLHSIAAAITTYIVILVQFRNADGHHNNP